MLTQNQGELEQLRADLSQRENQLLKEMEDEREQHFQELEGQKKRLSFENSTLSTQLDELQKRIENLE